MEFSYQTIENPITEVLLREKGSKFITYAFPTSSIEEVEKYLEEVKTKHPKATHHCYAYRLGIAGEEYRANDDGEPSGSAGLPIYNQLLAHEVTDILVVVVRYYGGTKLGVGGLIKIYKESAKAALDQATPITRELTKMLNLRFGYEFQSPIYQIINKHHLTMDDLNQGIDIRLRLKIKAKMFEEIRAQFQDLKGVEIQ